MVHVSNKDAIFIQKAITEATKSPLQRARHGCVIRCNGDTLSVGYNHYRSHSKNKLLENRVTCHAEIHAIHNVISRHKMHIDYLTPNIKKKFRSCTLYVVRLDRFEKTAMSAPCKHCLSIMKQCGIKRVVYSDDDGNFQACKTCDLETNFTTSGDKFIIRTL